VLYSILLGIVVSFSQILSIGTETTGLDGKIYFEEDSDEALMIVENPINQWIRHSPGLLEIYYPDDQRLFHIHFSDANPQNPIPEIKPYDTTMFTAAGLTLVNQKAIGDTVRFQYLNQKDQYPIITAKSLNGQIVELIIVADPADYQIINQIEYSQFEERAYLKRYRVRKYHDNELTENILYQFDNMKTASESERDLLDFKPPESIPIEHKYLN